MSIPDEWKRWAIGSVVSVAVAVGGGAASLYSSANARWNTNEHAIIAIDHRLVVVEERGDDNRESNKRIEQKLDSMILDDYRHNHLRQPPPPPLIADPDLYPTRPLPSANRSNP